MSEAVQEKDSNRILVPTDFSEPARAALGRAMELARALDARIALVHVLDLTALAVPMAEPAFDVGPIADAMREDAERALADLVKSADPERRRIADARVCAGMPAQTIVEIAKRERPRMIVMGTHGRTGFSRFLMGSVAERVVRLAPCDVLTVRAAGAAEDSRVG